MPFFGRGVEAVGATGRHPQRLIENSFGFSFPTGDVQRCDEIGNDVVVTGDIFTRLQLLPCALEQFEPFIKSILITGRDQTGEPDPLRGEYRFEHHVRDGR